MLADHLTRIEEEIKMKKHASEEALKAAQAQPGKPGGKPDPKKDLKAAPKKG